MTKKSDMASRYAAAHARREQRKRQAATREYLPLAEQSSYHEPDLAASTANTGRTRTGLGRTTAATLSTRLPAMDYGYLRADLLRTAVLAVALFAIIIILSFFIR